jgi:hypothetical protein
LTEPAPDLIVAIGEVAATYGIRLSVGDHAGIARRLAEKDRATLTRRDVVEAFERQGLRAPRGYTKDLIARWSALVPPNELLAILLDYRMDAIDALSAEFGGKKKPEEALRNSLRMYLKGNHLVESRTAKGHTDILIPSRRAIIEVKVWTARQKYEDGLVELAEYIRTARPPTKEAFFVLFCDDDPLPEVMQSRDQAIIETRDLSGLNVPVVAIPFQMTAPSKKAYTARRRSAGGR